MSFITNDMIDSISTPTPYSLSLKSTMQVRKIKSWINSENYKKQQWNQTYVSQRSKK